MIGVLNNPIEVSMKAFSELKVRLPPELKDTLKERAKTNHRNMNGEVVALIEAATRPTEDQKEK